MSPLVDTLQATRQLEKAGFATPQAEAIVTIVAHAGTRLATKDDIERLQVATKEDIRRLQAANKEDIERLQVANKEDIERLQVATKKDVERLQVATKKDIERLQVATKKDIERLQVATKKDIQSLRTELTAMMDTKIADLRSDLLAKMSQQTNKQLMVMFAALGLLFVALRFT